MTTVIFYLFIYLFLGWLDDIGLPQYKDQFNDGRVDGQMLQYLTVVSLLEVMGRAGWHRILKSNQEVCFNFLKMRKSESTTFDMPKTHMQRFDVFELHSSIFSLSQNDLLFLKVTSQLRSFKKKLCALSEMDRFKGKGGE